MFFIAIIIGILWFSASSLALAGGVSLPALPFRQAGFHRLEKNL